MTPAAVAPLGFEFYQEVTQYADQNSRPGEVVQ